MKDRPAAPREINDLDWILKQLFQTREVRHLSVTLVQPLLMSWAGKSRIKQLFSNMVSTLLNHQSARPDDGGENDKIRELLKDDLFVGKLFGLIPDIINGISEIMSHIHKTDPVYFSQRLEPGIQKLISATDFAELKEALEGSNTDALAFFEMINTLIWQYPSKVVSLLSFLPSFVNMAAGSLTKSLSRFNAVPPDLLADIMNSLADEIDITQTADLVNEIAEISRKLSVGSALIGDPGNPRLEATLARSVETLVSHLDMEVFWKGKLGLAAFGTAIDDALAEEMSQNPPLLTLSMKNTAKLMNMKMRAANEKGAALENLEDDLFDTALKAWLSTIEPFEAGEVINTLLRLVNRAQEQDSDMLQGVVQQFFDALDEDELAVAVADLFKTGGEDIKPLARTVVPKAVIWVCEVLAPRDDEYEDQAKQARIALGSLLMTEEV